MTYTTGVLLFENLEELDAIGPWEVFTMAANERGSGKVVTISQHGGLVRCAKVNFFINLRLWRKICERGIRMT